MHEDYQEDAVLAWQIDSFDVFMLTPVDLALSKLTRWQDHDQRDVRLLAKAGLIHSVELENRAKEALAGAIGNLNMFRINLDEALRIVNDNSVI